MTRPDVSPDLVIDPDDARSAPTSASAGVAYDKDFYGWTRAQVAALQRDDFAALDMPNLIEEIDSLGRAQINALRSRYYRLCVHLLKLAKQPRKATRSCRGTVSHQRIEIAQVLEESPSLKSKKAALFAKAYADARKQASIETGLALETFPTEPPFSIEEAEAEGWLP